MEWIFAAVVLAGIVWFLASIFRAKKGFSSFLAARYLKPERSFLSVITIISVLGVTLGVTVMTVVMAVFTGFGEKMKEVILGFEPHMIVDNRGIMGPEWYEHYEKLKEIEGLMSVTPYVRGQVIMDFNGLRSAPMIRGILPPEGAEKELMDSKIYKPASESDFIQDGGVFSLDINEVVVGDGIARNQGMQVGDTVVVYSPKEVMEISKVVDDANAAATEEERQAKLDEIKEITAPMELTVVGIFNSGHYEFDNNIIFTSLEDAQILYNFSIDNQVHGISIRGEDAFNVAEYEQKVAEYFGGEPVEASGGVSQTWIQIRAIALICLNVAFIFFLILAIRFKETKFYVVLIVLFVVEILLAIISIPGPPRMEIAGTDFRILSWTEMHKGIFDAIAMERQMMYLILFIIMIVSAFCIMNTTITTTVQKRSEIGLMKALGARESQIATIFVSQGILVGVIGIVVGQLIAQLIIFYRNDLGAYLGQNFGVNFFNEAVYGFGELPSAQTVGSVAVICGISLLVSALAALLPAMMASMEEPAKALRSD